MTRPIIAVLLASGALIAQSAPQFDVASIKPNKSGVGYWQTRPFQGGHFAAVNASLKNLIGLAWGIRDFQIESGPSWLSSEHYDLEAKAEGDPSYQQLGPMLQALLENRFQLKVHRETKELPVYALVVMKNGPKFHASDLGPCPPKETPEESCGGVRFSQSGLSVKRMPMSAVTDALAGLGGFGLGGSIGRPVVDETGLQGNFDFTLEWTPDPNGPSIFTALQEQLGLKLEPATRPLDVVIVGHAEHPSEN